MKRQDRISKLIIAILVLNTVGGIVLALFMYSFITDPSSAFNRSLAIRIQTVMGQFRPLDGIKGDKGDSGEDGKDGLSVVGPQGPKGDSIIGPQGPNGANGISIEGPKGEPGEPGQNGTPSPQATFRCDPDTKQFQYKYPLDEDWVNMGAKCDPIERNDNAIR